MRARSALLVPVLGLLLAGCNDEPAAAPPPPPPSSAAATAEPLAVPASATPATPQGAANFARYYLEVLNRANNSGDVEQLRAISHPDCNTCREFIDAIVKEEAEGKRFVGGEYTVDSAEATQDVPGDAVVDVFYDRAASATRAADGTVDAGPAESDQLLQMRVVMDRGSWKARGIRFPEVPT